MTPTSFGIILISLVVLYFWQKLQQSYHKTKFKHDINELIYILEDELIKNPSIKNNWLYGFFINSCNGLIYNIDKINLYLLIIVLLKHSNDESTDVLKNKLNEDIHASDFFTNIRVKQTLVMFDLLKNQNKISYYIIFYPFISVVSGVSNVKEWFKNNIAQSISYPEFHNANSMSIHY